MNNKILMTVRDPTEHLFYDHSGNFLWVNLIFLHHFVDLVKEFLSITQLHHHKNMAFVFKYFKEADDIRMVQIFHYGNLNLQLFFHFRAHPLFIDDFNCSLFILTFLSAFVNFTICTHTNSCVAVDYVIVIYRDTIMLWDKDSRVHNHIFLFFNNALLEITEILND